MLAMENTCSQDYAGSDILVVDVVVSRGFVKQDCELLEYFLDEGYFFFFFWTQ